MNKIKHYSSKGILLGNLWGGGEGSYPTIKLGEMSLKALKKQALEYLADGSLDSGMGFKSLIGAILPVKVTETVKVDGKEYQREYFVDDLIIGNLTKKQESFLYECLEQL